VCDTRQIDIPDAIVLQSTVRRAKNGHRRRSAVTLPFEQCRSEQNAHDAVRPDFFLLAEHNKMDFDLKLFFKDPPRFREDLKHYMHDLAKKIVLRVCQHMKALNIDRLLPRHVSLIMFQMCQDPVTRYMRHGLSCQAHRVKPLSKVFAKVLCETTIAIEKEHKNGNIDRKIIKGTQNIIDENGMKSSNVATVLVASCVAEVCGIMLNDARQCGDKKTITLDILQEASTTHVLSNGEACKNISLARFITSIYRPMLSEFQVEVEESTRKRKPDRHLVDKQKRRILEEKTVKFAAVAVGPRPATPDHCFWEE
tara:strand:- start:2081 stop:3010 length:930 start_codon:yes stop_codon:yes gene_type:complete